MAWILDNLQLVIIIATTVAWWLNQRREAAKAGQEENDESQAPRPPTLAEGRESPWTPVDYEEQERARKIQEEIRRKIAERLAGGAPRPVVIESYEQDEPPALPPPVPVAPARREAAPAWGMDDAAAAERTQRMSEQLVELERQRRDVEQRAREFSAAGGVAAPARAASAYDMKKPGEHGSRSSWAALLRNPTEARRAIVLREILGTPVGMRRA